MLRLVALVLTWPAAGPCVTDFRAADAYISRDYAGLADKTAEWRAAYRAAMDTIRADVARADDAASETACDGTLARWMGWFHDGHLHIRTIGPRHREALAQPSFAILDSATTVLRLPSFRLESKRSIDSLLAANWPAILGRRRLVIDLRGNGGGGDAAFANVIPLLYSGPIRVVGADMWASRGNRAYYESMLGGANGGLVQQLVAKMRRHPGTFVPIDNDTVFTLDTVLSTPSMVAVLIDRRVASASEEFLLEAQQSRKVTIFGSEPSQGALDYSNVRVASLPSGKRELQFGTSRSRRLPAHPVDGEGIQPNVRVPVDSDAVSYALAR